jgi:twinkle protein
MTFDFMAEGIDVRLATGGPEVKALCPRCSHTRKKRTQKCLNVNLETGVWHCWHCEWSGKAEDPRQATVPRRVTSDRPKAWAQPKLQPLGMTETALRWFELRGITPDVLERNRVTTAKVYMPQLEQEVTAIALPFYRAGLHVDTKYRDSAKNFRRETGARRVLYGFDDIEATTIIVEGEMDKLAVEVAGFRNCVSVPDGAPAENTKNIESKFDFLDDDKVAAVKRWIIAVDNDGPGKRLQDELVRRLGPEKCVVATWPDGCKDANDVLVQQGCDGLRAAIEAAAPVPIDGVFGADQFADDFLEMYDNGVPNGLTTGWDCLDRFLRIQPGQLMVVTGIPGHGKSEFDDALCVNLALEHGWKTAMFSPENYPVRLHMMKLAEKYIEKPYNPGPLERMTREEAARAADWIAEHFVWIMPEQPTLDAIIDAASALVLRNGIRCLVIDPWNEVEHARPAGMTEAEYVGVSLMRLRRFARKHEVLVIVVAHPRLIEKKDGGYPVPTPYDISGGANWRNKADNCLTVYADLLDPHCGVQIHVQKVKFKLFGQVGVVHMTWDRPTGRYFSRLIP